MPQQHAVLLRRTGQLRLYSQPSRLTADEQIEWKAVRHGLLPEAPYVGLHLLILHPQRRSAFRKLVKRERDGNRPRHWLPARIFHDAAERYEARYSCTGRRCA